MLLACAFALTDLLMPGYDTNAKVARLARVLRLVRLLRLLKLLKYVKHMETETGFPPSAVCDRRMRTLASGISAAVEQNASVR